MPVELVDYSWGRPGGAALRAAGKAAAIRYLLDDGQGGKGLDASEVADLHAHGVGIVACLEISADGWRGGHDGGVKHGQLAAQQMAALGFPADRPCYFCVDRNTTPADYPAVDAYLAGCAQGIGSAARVGVYGEADVVDHCWTAKSAAHFWQTYAWSAGRISPNAEILQYLNGQTLNGAAVDLDRAMVRDYGQWPKPPTTYRLQVAAGATVTHYALANGCLDGTKTTKWGPKASSAPCGAPRKVRGCHSGSAIVVPVPLGAFARRWVKVDPAHGVTVKEQ